MAGKDIKDVAEFMGDTEESVRRNYEHLDPEYLAHMVD
jgi:site-specific recombinase XerC